MISDLFFWICIYFHPDHYNREEIYRNLVNIGIANISLIGGKHG